MYEQLWDGSEIFLVYSLLMNLRNDCQFMVSRPLKAMRVMYVPMGGSEVSRKCGGSGASPWTCQFCPNKGEGGRGGSSVVAMVWAKVVGVVNK